MGQPATLTEWITGKGPASGGRVITVDFNPSSLTVSYATMGPSGAQGGTGSAPNQDVSRQRTGTTTTLSVELLFDDTADGVDVRNKTQILAAMVRPGEANRTDRVIRFVWGTFIFEGSIQSMNETLDYFSAEGVPLRATVRLTFQGVEERAPASGGGGGAGAGAGFGASASAGFSASAGASAGFSAGASAGFSAGVGASAGVSAGVGISAGAAVGTTPFTFAASGDSIQSLSGSASWKAVAEANGIENPRLLEPGTLIDVNVSTT